MLTYGGYIGQPVSLGRSAYRSSSGGDAYIEVGKHPPEYKYVAHDFFGTFRHMAEEERKAHPSGADAEGLAYPPRFVDWFQDGQHFGGNVYLIIRHTGKAYNGLVGWYTDKEDRVTTVMIRFGAIGGIPADPVD